MVRISSGRLVRSTKAMAALEQAVVDDQREHERAEDDAKKRLSPASRCPAPAVTRMSAPAASGNAACTATLVSRRRSSARARTSATSADAAPTSAAGAGRPAPP